MDSDKSAIEKLKQSLYSRDEDVVPKEKRTPVKAIDSSVPEHWGEKPSFEMMQEEIDINMAGKKNNFFNKFFVVALGFFVVAVGVAALVFFGGINNISSNNVDIKITAPSSASSGEEIDIGLSMVNGNRTDLSGATLYIDYPIGVRSVDSKNTSVSREKVDLGVIPHGGSKDYPMRVLLLGAKDTVKIMTFTLEYKVAGSNATFSKQKTYDVTIGSSPIILNVSYPKEINSGQQVNLDIDVISNSSEILSNVLVKVQYPYGYSFSQSNIKPLRDNMVFQIGDLKNGDKKRLHISGTLVGQNMEERSFLVSVGTPSSEKSQDFDVSLADTSATVAIRKSFFDLSLSSDTGGVSQPGMRVPVVVSWQNTLSEKIVSSRIVATLGGNALDQTQTVPGDGGFYQSSNNTVVWDKNSTAILREIVPNADGSVRFSVGSLAPSVVLSMKNPNITIHLDMRGDRESDNSSPIVSSQDLIIKLESSLSLTAKSFRMSGPFTNIGPLPPRADKESTYTITLAVTNTSNDLKNATVVATLPAGVSWKGETSPSSERISYDPDTKKVLWNIGTVGAGTGYAFSPKEASFKVGLIPSVTQINSTPILVSAIHVEAQDSYTSTTLSQDVSNVNTIISDSSYKSGQEVVVK